MSWSSSSIAEPHAMVYVPVSVVSIVTGSVKDPKEMYRSLTNMGSPTGTRFSAANVLDGVDNIMVFTLSGFPNCDSGMMSMSLAYAVTKRTGISNWMFSPRMTQFDSATRSPDRRFIDLLPTIVL